MVCTNIVYVLYERAERADQGKETNSKWSKMHPGSVPILCGVIVLSILFLWSALHRLITRTIPIKQFRSRTTTWPLVYCSLWTKKQNLFCYELAKTVQRGINYWCVAILRISQSRPNSLKTTTDLNLWTSVWESTAHFFAYSLFTTTNQRWNQLLSWALQVSFSPFLSTSCLRNNTICTISSLRLSCHANQEQKRMFGASTCPPPKKKPINNKEFFCRWHVMRCSSLMAAHGYLIVVKVCIKRFLAFWDVKFIVKNNERNPASGSAKHWCQGQSHWCYPHYSSSWRSQLWVTWVVFSIFLALKQLEFPISYHSLLLFSIFLLWRLLASMSLLAGEKKDAVKCIGPRGLERMISTALELSATYLTYKLEVRWVLTHHLVQWPSSFFFSYFGMCHVQVIELEEGKSHDLGFIDGYHLTAYPIVHKVPCFGYLIQEPEKPGQLDAKRASLLGSILLSSCTSKDHHRYSHRQRNTLEGAERRVKRQAVFF